MTPVKAIRVRVGLIKNNQKLKSFVQLGRILTRTFVYLVKYFIKKVPINISFKILFLFRCPSEADEDDLAAFSDTAVANVTDVTSGDVAHRQRRRSVPPSTANIYCVEPPVKSRPSVRSASCGQSYKASTIINCDSRVVPDLKISHITTLES